MKKTTRLIAALATASTTYAVTLTSVGVTVTETFDTLPAITDWSTVVKGDSNTAITTAAELDNAVNNGSGTMTAFTSGEATTVLSTSTTLPPSASNLGRWQSVRQHVLTRPTNNHYSTLMATVLNSTGSTLNSLTVEYDFSTPDGIAVEEVPGHRVYFSSTGAANSWSLLNNFSGVTVAATLNQTISGLNWATGTQAYILWADDNAAATDSNFAIDNVRWTGATAVPEPSTYGLLGAGALSAIALARRRRKIA